jgi:hypothetical protein
MKLLRFLAMMFIDALSITYPSIEERDRTALHIVSLLTAMMLLVSVLPYPALHFLHL